MAIICVSWVNGSSGGDGSPGNPFQKIQEAAPVAAGDEIRVEKSADPIALSGTLTFNNGLVQVQTSVDLTSELSPGDFIISNNPTNEYGYWEVNSLTSTEITLFKVYAGISETIDANKLQPIDTGNAISTNETIQQNLYSGAFENPILLSGGWNSTFDAVTGETWYRQGCLPYSTNRYGIGLYFSSRNYVDISRIHFVRYYYNLYARSSISLQFLGEINLLSGGRYGFYSYNNTDTYIEDLNVSQNNLQGLYYYLGGSGGNKTDKVRAFSNSSYGIYAYNLSGLIINNIHTERNSSRGIRIYRCNGMFMDNIITKNNGSYGIEVYSCAGCFISNFESHDNMTYGLRLYLSNFNTLAKINIHDESVGINVNQAFGNTMFHLTVNNNINDVGITSNFKDVFVPNLTVKHYNNPNDDRYFFYDGDILRIQGAETLDGDGIKFEPNPLSAFNYFFHTWTNPTAAGIDTVLELYVKKDAAFNGQCYGCAFYMGTIIVDWIEFVLTEDYQKFEIPVSGILLTDTTDLSLLIRVNGTAGSVYADGFPDHTIEDVLAELLAFRGIVEPRLPDNFIMGSSDAEDYNDEILAIKERSDRLPDNPAPTQEYDTALGIIAGNVAGLNGEPMRGTNLVPLNPLLSDDTRITTLVANSEAHTLILDFLEKMESGDWKIEAPNDLYFYEAGTIIEVAHWKCFDSDGLPTVTEIAYCTRV